MTEMIDQYYASPLLKQFYVELGTIRRRSYPAFIAISEQYRSGRAIENQEPEERRRDAFGETMMHPYKSLNAAIFDILQLADQAKRFSDAGKQGGETDSEIIAGTKRRFERQRTSFERIETSSSEYAQTEGKPTPELQAMYAMIDEAIACCDRYLKIVQGLEAGTFSEKDGKRGL